MQQKYSALEGGRRGTLRNVGALRQPAENRRWKALALSGLLLLCPQALRAENANLQLNLVITAPPDCASSPDPIIVDFGDVLSTRIDGVGYKKTQLVYALNCSAPASNLLKMTLEGLSAGFSGALRTNIANLGIAFYRDSARVNLSSASGLSFTNGSPPNLYAVPIKAAGATLTTGGNFSASATMKIDYN